MPERNIYISYLRVLATIAVVAIHASTGFLNKFAPLSFDWNYANWINALTRCSVPIFVAISGILLLQKEESISDFYKKRIPKIVLPFIFWTIVFIIYYFLRLKNFDQLTWLKIAEITYQKLLKGANAHLWYLYMITGLYLAIPFIRKFVQKASLREMEYFLLFWVLTSLLKHQIIRNHFPNLDLSFFTGYLGYLILGYYLSIKQINWSKYISAIGYLGAVGFTGLITYYYSYKANKYDPSFYNYLTANSIIATAACIAFATQTISKSNIFPKWMDIIARYSFGIYLGHIVPRNYIHPYLAKHVAAGILMPTATC